MKAPAILRADLLGMYQQLQQETLKVGLIPAPDPQFSGHMIRIATQENPEWYREFCRSHPSSSRVRKKSDTVVKRRETLRVLRRLASGKETDSKYAEELIEIALDLSVPF